MPNSPKSVLRQDLLEHLEATIIFKEVEMDLRVKNEQLIEILSLSLIQQKSKKRTSLKQKKSLIRHIQGVWVSEVPGKAKNALPVKVEMKRGGLPSADKTISLKIRGPGGNQRNY